jgi:periplasmic divalent cation tolerance protein
MEVLRNMSPTYSVILTTVGSQAEGDQLAALLVKEKLAACVQAMAISSTYAWQGSLQKDPEWLLLIKTRADLYPQVEEALLDHHSYETPEIIQVPITRGSQGYLGWVDENTIGD